MFSSKPRKITALLVCVCLLFSETAHAAPLERFFEVYQDRPRSEARRLLSRLAQRFSPLQSTRSEVRMHKADHEKDDELLAIMIHRLNQALEKMRFSSTGEYTPIPQIPGSGILSHPAPVPGPIEEPQASKLDLNWTSLSSLILEGGFNEERWIEERLPVVFSRMAALAVFEDGERFASTIPYPLGDKGIIIFSPIPAGNYRLEFTTFEEAVRQFPNSQQAYIHNLQNEMVPEGREKAVPRLREMLLQVTRDDEVQQADWEALVPKLLGPEARIVRYGLDRRIAFLREKLEELEKSAEAEVLLGPKQFGNNLRLWMLYQSIAQKERDRFAERRLDSAQRSQIEVIVIGDAAVTEAYRNQLKNLGYDIENKFHSVTNYWEADGLLKSALIPHAVLSMEDLPEEPDKGPRAWQEYFALARPGLEPVFADAKVSDRKGDFRDYIQQIESQIARRFPRFARSEVRSSKGWDPDDWSPEIIIPGVIEGLNTERFDLSSFDPPKEFQNITLGEARLVLLALYLKRRKEGVLEGTKFEHPAVLVLGGEEVLTKREFDEFIEDHHDLDRSKVWDVPLWLDTIGLEQAGKDYAEIMKGTPSATDSFSAWLGLRELYYRSLGRLKLRLFELNNLIRAHEIVPGETSDPIHDRSIWRITVNTLGKNFKPFVADIGLRPVPIREINEEGDALKAEPFVTLPFLGAVEEREGVVFDNRKGGIRITNNTKGTIVIFEEIKGPEKDLGMELDDGSGARSEVREAQAEEFVRTTRDLKMPAGVWADARDFQTWPAEVLGELLTLAEEHEAFDLAVRNTHLIRESELSFEARALLAHPKVHEGGPMPGLRGKQILVNLEDFVNHPSAEEIRKLNARAGKELLRLQYGEAGALTKFLELVESRGVAAFIRRLEHPEAFPQNGRWVVRSEFIQSYLSEMRASYSIAWSA